MQFGTDPRKLVRSGDPDTSHFAAESVDSEKLERIVYNTICSFGQNGCISDQVRGALPGLPYSSVTARFKALLDRGLVEDTGERRVGISGKKQRVIRERLDNGQRILPLF